jgi:hypothetical protein
MTLLLGLLAATVAVVVALGFLLRSAERSQASHARKLAGESVDRILQSHRSFAALSSSITAHNELDRLPVDSEADERFDSDQERIRYEHFWYGSGRADH